MANPRQRRKARSGKHKVRLSKQANTKLKKVTPRNIPGPLLESYNPRQTPRQNYNRLGLLSGKLAPRLSGGIERDTDLSKNWWTKTRNHQDEFNVSNDHQFEQEQQQQQQDEEELSKEEEDSSVISSKEKPTPKLSKGEGRIIRDSNGKIIKVVIGDEEAEMELDPTTSDDPARIVINHEKSTCTPWGNPLPKATYEQDPNVINAPKVPVLQGIGYQNPRQGVVPAKTQFVQELEKISIERMNKYTENMKNKQHLSENQINWLHKLIEKYGIHNVDRMALDTKLNKYQKTQAEIRFLISKLN